MIRRRLFGHPRSKEFRLRGNEIYRIEAFSDAVLAFSLSLLMVSLEVPQTFHELTWIINGAIPFFCTVALIFLFWHEQYLFFRRYGLADIYINVLNLAYLAIILFYVYPLKFLFSLLIDAYTPLNLFPLAREKGLVVLTNEEFPQLVILFSVGYCLIWFLIWLMHQRVLHQQQLLQLDKHELLLTKKELNGAMANAFIGIAAIAFSWMKITWLAGICYLLIPLVLIINHRVYVRYRNRMLSTLQQKNGGQKFDPVLPA